MKKDILNIPLKDITKEQIGIYHFGHDSDISELYQKDAHRRNDHYVFILLFEGTGNIAVDFNNVELSPNSVFCIQPGQVHLTSFVDRKTEACLLIADAELVDENNRSIFENTYFDYQCVQMDITMAMFIKQFIQTLKSSQILNTINPEPFYTLTRACITQIGVIYEKDRIVQTNESRKNFITRSFKRSLLCHYKIHKTTAPYAGELHITPAYLNDIIKETTGSPVSYWIQKIIITEAQRLLYATDMTVKEIAFELGFKDPAHYNRFFSKRMGLSPLQFRKKNLK